MIETKKLLQLTAVLVLISVTIFLVILFRVDPYNGGKAAVVYFLISFFLALSGLLTFLGYNIRRMINKDKVRINNFSVSLRQSILISTAIVGLLILKSMQSLSWWDGVLLITALVFLELFFRS
jgi:hypothetical protein